MQQKTNDLLAKINLYDEYLSTGNIDKIFDFYNVKENQEDIKLIFTGSKYLNESIFKEYSAKIFKIVDTKIVCEVLSPLFKTTIENINDYKSGTKKYDELVEFLNINKKDLLFYHSINSRLFDINQLIISTYVLRILIEENKLDYVDIKRFNKYQGIEFLNLNNYLITTLNNYVSENNIEIKDEDIILKLNLFKPNYIEKAIDSNETRSLKSKRIAIALFIPNGKVTHKVNQFFFTIINSLKTYNIKVYIYTTDELLKVKTNMGIRPLSIRSDEDFKNKLPNMETIFNNSFTDDFNTKSIESVLKNYNVEYEIKIVNNFDINEQISVKFSSLGSKVKIEKLRDIFYQKEAINLVDDSFDYIVSLNPQNAIDPSSLKVIKYLSNIKDNEVALTLDAQFIMGTFNSVKKYNAFYESLDGNNITSLNLEKFRFIRDNNFDVITNLNFINDTNENNDFLPPFANALEEDLSNLNDEEINKTELRNYFNRFNRIINNTLLYQNGTVIRFTKKELDDREKKLKSDVENLTKFFEDDNFDVNLLNDYPTIKLIYLIYNLDLNAIEELLNIVNIEELEESFRELQRLLPFVDNPYIKTSLFLSLSIEVINRYKDEKLMPMDPSLKEIYNTFKEGNEINYAVLIQKYFMVRDNVDSLFVLFIIKAKLNSKEINEENMDIIMKNYSSKLTKNYLISLNFWKSLFTYSIENLNIYNINLTLQNSTNILRILSIFKEDKLSFKVQELFSSFTNFKTIPQVENEYDEKNFKSGKNRVALVLTGQIRGDYEYLLKHHYKNVVKPLRESGYEVDVYLNTWDKFYYKTSRNVSMTTSIFTALGLEFPNTINKITEITKTPYDVVEEKVREIVGDPNITVNILDEKYIVKNKDINQQRMFYIKYAAFLKLLENKKGYEHVIYNRIDGLFMNPITNEVLQNRKENQTYITYYASNGVADYSFISSMKDAYKMVNVWEYIVKKPDFIFLSRNDKLFHSVAEPLVLYWILYQRIKVSIFNLPYGSTNGPYYFNVYKIYDFSEELKKDLENIDPKYHTLIEKVRESLLPKVLDAELKTNKINVNEERNANNQLDDVPTGSTPNIDDEKIEKQRSLIRLLKKFREQFSLNFGKLFDRRNKNK